MRAWSKYAQNKDSELRSAVCNCGALGMFIANRGFTFGISGVADPHQGSDTLTLESIVAERPDDSNICLFSEGSIGSHARLANERG